MALRFAFGKNWQNFLSLLDDERIAEAEKSLREMLGTGRLDGKKFLDIGSGSGLFSLAARRLGADVFSFDYDAGSVACTQSLKDRFFGGDTHWTVTQGSVLDSAFLKALPKADIVYSWGVLHHTGVMWQALENVSALVGHHGTLFISIYNDQGVLSKYWWQIKRLYNKSPAPVRFLFLCFFACLFESVRVVRRIARGESPLPFNDWKKKKKQRGMSMWYDLVDWIGGFPFEVAKPEQIFDFFKSRGFQLQKLKTQAGSLGCCEYVFSRM